MDRHLEQVEDALQSLQSCRSGISPEVAALRLQEHGPNELKESGGRTRLQIIWEQLTATMVLILIAAAGAASVLGDMKNAMAIIAIVTFYTLLGFVQEYRAERAMAALKRMSVPTVRVIRDGITLEIQARHLVPGDIVLLEAGNIVPADGRVIEAINLQIQESALTGESEPVVKVTEPMTREDSPLGDRRNMAYLGTTVTRGRGTIVVTDTGMGTELGKIAALMERSAVVPTPLQRRLDRLGKNLAGIGTGIAVVIFLLGLANGDNLRHMVLVAVSVAVAIVPEGLPAVVTITLALGAQRMLRRNALIRRLSAVETLGSVTVICTDKTGTLTENRMTVVHLESCDSRIETSEELAPLDECSGIRTLLVGATLCNDARLVAAGNGNTAAMGDPTEGALIIVADRYGIRKDNLEQGLPRVGEIAFDSERKRMTTMHLLALNRCALEIDTEGAAAISFTKGSVDGLLPLCSAYLSHGSCTPMAPAVLAQIAEAGESLARRGIRVMGVSCRLFAPPPQMAHPIEQDQVFIGLIGMIDPPRQEARQSIATTRASGVRTVMITGDHPLTAAEIGRQLGISEGRVMTGAEMDALPKDELQHIVSDVTVFARVSPEHKLKIIEALQANGQVVSMTGDGVNDGPALRKADIGVAMGVAGTDVAKEASDLVLLDDNFATIVAAIAEGRTIFDNIRKFIHFSVAGNLGKVLVMLLAPLIGKPVPLLPLQLLWLNLLTDGLLGLGLGVEPMEEGVMRRPPHPPQGGVFTRTSVRKTALIGCLIGACGLAVGASYYFGGKDTWRTMIFTSLAFSQVGQALAVRTGAIPITRKNCFGNPLLLAMTGAVVVLQLMVVYLPPLQPFFSTQPLRAQDLGIAALTGLVVLVLIEWYKTAARKNVDTN